jgi:hypothetical protein
MTSKDTTIKLGDATLNEIDPHKQNRAISREGKKDTGLRW